MTAQEFLSQLDARLAKYDLLGHPFYRAWSGGQLTRSDLCEYAREYFPHVDALPAYLEEFALRLPNAPLRRAVAAIRDEAMGSDGSRPHSELWLDFAEGVGGTRNPGASRVPEMKNLISHLHQVARDGAPEEVLASFYACDRQISRAATENACGLREMYGVDEKTCGYFALVAAGVYRSNVWRSQLEKLVEDRPAAEQRALTAAETTATALWGGLDGINAARTARAA
jgi:pyrroloquinoline-quinone synthase